MMEATRIRSLTRNLVEDRREEHQAREKHANTIKKSIESANEQITAAFKLFAHTQLVQNATAFGRDVTDLANAAANAMEQNRDRINSLRVTIDEVEDQLTSLRRELNAANQTVYLKLQNDPEFLTLKSELDVCAQDRTNGKKTYGQLQQEVAEKLPAYDADKAFRYLLGARYDTPEYASNVLTARLDAMLARRSHFTTNKENYSILLGIRANAESLMDGIEDRYASALSIYETYEANAYQTNEIIGIKESINRFESELRNRTTELQACLNQEQNHLASTDGLSMEAKALVFKLLKQKDTHALSALAEATASPEDDQALLVINHALDKISALKGELDVANDKLRISELALARANELRRTVDGDSRLSGDRYEYSSESRVVDLLNGFVIGTIASSDLVSDLKRHSEYVPPPPPPSSSDYSFSSSSSFGGSDSFSTSSSISSSSDSFSTTDSF